METTLSVSKLQEALAGSDKISNVQVTTGAVFMSRLQEIIL